MCETLAKHDERACTCKWLKVAGPAADSDPDFDVDYEEAFDEAFDANFDADFKPGLKTDLRAAHYTETDKDLEYRALLRSDRGYGTVFHGQTPVYPGSRTGDWLVQLFGMRNKCVLRPIRHEAHFDAQGTFHNSYYTFSLISGFGRYYDYFTEGLLAEVTESPLNPDYDRSKPKSSKPWARPALAGSKFVDSLCWVYGDFVLS